MQFADGNLEDDNLEDSCQKTVILKNLGKSELRLGHIEANAIREEFIKKSDLRVSVYEPDQGGDGIRALHAKAEKDATNADAEVRSMSVINVCTLHHGMKVTSETISRNLLLLRSLKAYAELQREGNYFTRMVLSIRAYVTEHLVFDVRNRPSARLRCIVQR